jgi:hypothetical protein
VVELGPKARTDSTGICFTSDFLQLSVSNRENGDLGDHGNTGRRNGKNTTVVYLLLHSNWALLVCLAQACH